MDLHQNSKHPARFAAAIAAKALVGGHRKGLLNDHLIPSNVCSNPPSRMCKFVVVNDFLTAHSITNRNYEIVREVRIPACALAVLRTSNKVRPWRACNAQELSTISAMYRPL